MLKVYDKVIKDGNGGRSYESGSHGELTVIDKCYVTLATNANFV